MKFKLSIFAISYSNHRFFCCKTAFISGVYRYNSRPMFKYSEKINVPYMKDRQRYDVIIMVGGHANTEILYVHAQNLKRSS